MLQHLDNDVIRWSLLCQQFRAMLLYEVSMDITGDELTVVAKIQQEIQIRVHTHNLQVPKPQHKR
jgi:hypothetical protein